MIKMLVRIFTYILILQYCSLLSFCYAQTSIVVEGKAVVGTGMTLNQGYEFAKMKAESDAVRQFGVVLSMKQSLEQEESNGEYNEDYKRIIEIYALRTIKTEVLDKRNESLNDEAITCYIKIRCTIEEDELNKRIDLKKLNEFSEKLAEGIKASNEIEEKIENNYVDENFNSDIYNNLISKLNNIYDEISNTIDYDGETVSLSINKILSKRDDDINRFLKDHELVFKHDLSELDYSLRIINSPELVLLNDNWCKLVIDFSIDVNNSYFLSDLKNDISKLDLKETIIKNRFLNTFNSTSKNYGSNLYIDSFYDEEPNLVFADYSNDKLIRKRTITTSLVGVTLLDNDNNPLVLEKNSEVIKPFGSSEIPHFIALTLNEDNNNKPTDTISIKIRFDHSKPNEIAKSYLENIYNIKTKDNKLSGVIYINQNIIDKIDKINIMAIQTY